MHRHLSRVLFYLVQKMVCYRVGLSALFRRGRVNDSESGNLIRSISGIVLFVLCGEMASTGQPRPTPPVASPAALMTINLQTALERARNYAQPFQSAIINAALAREDRIQAKAAMLPSLNHLNQYIYTEGNGTPSGVFVANDGVHVYNEQAVIHQELFSIVRRAEYRRAVAAEAVARARQDIAARGLVVTVVQSYYTLVAQQRRYANTERSLEE